MGDDQSTENPYAYVPTPVHGRGRREKWSVGKKLAVWGAWMQLGFPVSVIGFGLVLATDSLSIDADAPSPSLSPFWDWLSAVAWIPAYGGIVMALVGYILLLIALMAKSYRAKWFFWFLMIYGVLLTLAMPLIPFGAVCVIYCLVRRTDFFRGRRYGRDAY